MTINKKLKFTFTIIIGAVTLVSSIMFKVSYANNYKFEREKSLYNTTISNMIYNSTNEVSKGPSRSVGKIAYITIDDGPSKYTNDILEVLNKYNAKATFFMIDSNMKTYPNEVKSLIELGNTPGFHSVSHDIHKLYKTSESAKEEFDKNKQTLLEIVGVESNIVRLPYGSKPYTPTESYETIVESGYKIWDWDIDTEDWKLSPENVVENVKRNSNGKDNIVILMHERKYTSKSLEEILNYLSNEGYEFMPINENEIPKNYWLKNIR